MILLKVLLYIAVFINSWIIGRCISAECRNDDIPSLLFATTIVASFNIIIFAGFIFVSLD